MPNGLPAAADVDTDVESESLTGLPATRAYGLRPRVDEYDASHVVLDAKALARVKEGLAKHLQGSGVLMLHDLAVPATSTTIDHLCIGPNGLTVVDVDRAGDREVLVRRVTRETEILAAVLTEAGIGSERIKGAVCQTSRLPNRGTTLHGIPFGQPRRVAKFARADRGGRPLDVQLALAVVRNRLGFEGQRSFGITRPYRV